MLLAGRLKNVMSQDIHQEGDCYEIRSLYFDDLWDRCLAENEAGVDKREKYRIRIYDPQSDVIHLEIKEKNRGLTKKRACDLSRDECLAIMEGELPLNIDGRAPLNSLQLQMRCNGMEPKVIIAYERTAFVHPSGNVRITFDRNIMASRCREDFLEDRVSGMVPVLPAGMHVLEVKYDEFLPDTIAQQLEIGKLRKTAFSKYYLGRLAVRGEFPIER
jgi:hypothetical protein